MRQWLAVVGVALAACGGAGETMDPQAAAEPASGEAAVRAREAWPQQVWFQPPAGATLALLVPGEADGVVVATWSLPGAERLAARVAGPGDATPAQPMIRPGEPPRSTSTPDGASRAILTDDGDEVVLRTSGAVGAREAARFRAARRPQAPQFSADGGAVYVQLAGEQPAIVRVALADEPARAVVPGPTGPFVATRVGGREAVAFGDPESGGALVAAVVPDSPVEDAGIILGQVALPGDLLPVTLGTDGAPLIAVGCGETAPLSLRSKAGGVTVGDALATRAAHCGDGCTAWYAPAPSGAPRLVARLEDQGSGRWQTWLDASVGIATDHAVSGDATVGKLPGCLGEPSDGAWLATRLLRVDQASDRPSHLRAEEGGGLRVVSQKGPYVMVWTLAPAADRVGVPTVGDVSPYDALNVPTASGGAVRVDGRRIVQESSEGAVIELLAPAEDRDITGVVALEDGAVAMYTDVGSAPGLYRSQAGLPTPVPAVKASDLRHPILAVWSGYEVIAMLRTPPDAPWEVWVAEPFAEATQAAWTAGPITALRDGGTWAPVMRDGAGAWQPCAGPVVRLGADGEGGYLIVEVPGAPAQRLAVRGVAHDGPTRARVIAEGGLTATVLATRTAGDGVDRWDLHAVDAPGAATAWQAVAQAPAADGLAVCGR